MPGIWFSVDSGVSVGTLETASSAKISFADPPPSVVRAMAATAHEEIWLIADNQATGLPSSNSCSLWRIPPATRQGERMLIMPGYSGQKLIIDAFGYLWIALHGSDADKGKILQLTPTGEVAAAFTAEQQGVSFIPECLAYTKPDTIWAASHKGPLQMLTPADAGRSDLQFGVTPGSLNAQGQSFALLLKDVRGNPVPNYRVTLSVHPEDRAKATCVGYDYGQNYTVTVKTGSDGTASFAVHATRVEGPDKSVRLLAMARGLSEAVQVYRGVIASTSEVQLAIADLRGTFVSGSHPTIEIKGLVSGSGLGEHQRPDSVILSVRKPGDTGFQEVSKGQIIWASQWSSDGWGFTIQDVPSLPGTLLPHVVVQAALGSNVSLPASVQFPLKSFLSTVEFRDKDDNPQTDALSVAGHVPLKLHLVVRHPLNQLSLNIQLPDGVSGGALSTLAQPLQVNPNWDGHQDQHVLTTKGKDVVAIPAGKSSLAIDLEVPIVVAGTFREGAVHVTVHSDSEIVMPNDRIETQLPLVKA